MLEYFGRLFQDLKNFLSGKLGHQKANLGFEIITDDIDNFSMSGMIEPTFYNFGEHDVEVLHSVIKPGNKFFAGVVGMVMNNEVPIKFKGPVGSKRKLIVYYGSPVLECD